MTRLLVVTAVAAERDAILAGLGTSGVNAVEPHATDDRSTAGAHVLAVGVGIAAAAARTARWLTERQATGQWRTTP